jgi:hypothetical protein
MTAASAKQWLPRYPMQFPFVHKAKTPGPASVGVGWTRNLSEGGACVEVNEVLQARMPLRFFLRTDRGAIDAEGRVVWAGAPNPVNGGVRHGIAFTRLAPGQLRALTDLLLSKGPRREGGFRFPSDFAVTCHPRDLARPRLQGRVGDLSREGLMLRLGESLLPGTPLRLILYAAHGPLMIEGVIVWTQSPERRAAGEPISHGVRFTAPNWNLSLAIGLLLVGPLKGLPLDRLIERGGSGCSYELLNWAGQSAAARSPAGAIPRSRPKAR